MNNEAPSTPSFYEYLILSGELSIKDNPVPRHGDAEPASRTPSGDNRRLASRSRLTWQEPSQSRRQPMRRMLSVRTVQHLPRPMSDEQIGQLLRSLRRWRVMYSLRYQRIQSGVSDASSLRRRVHN